MASVATAAPPPNTSAPPPSAPMGLGFQPRYPFKPRYNAPPGSAGGAPPGGGGGHYPGPGGGAFARAPVHNPASTAGMTEADFDGKRLRKSLMRKTVDYNSAFLAQIEQRAWQRDFRDARALQPDVMHYPEMAPPTTYMHNPANAATTKFVKTATNKMRCPIFTLAWTPEGRRLITGASSGEFTLWNGLTFNFETILQAHDSPVRSMVWSHNDQWMVTGDHGGYVKYWQSNMNNVKMFQAHKEPVRCVSFSPTDSKFATCSDDGTVRVWDFFSCTEERVLRGHGSDVKCVDWHPTKGLLASGSKDNQQPVKIWEPKTGAVMCTLHAHKSTVMDLEWNKNGNWLLTASRDHLLKLFDIRMTKEEVQTFRGHKREASTVAWHPVHEGLFASGGSDGSIMFWNVGADKELGQIEQAHDSIVWSLNWHPVGHILCSGSNDHTCKFWTRNRPGDTMRDKYNLNTLPAGMEEDTSMAEAAVTSGPGGSVGGLSVAGQSAVIPGMTDEDDVEAGGDFSGTPAAAAASIPGLDALDPAFNAATAPTPASITAPNLSDRKKTPYAKPIPRNFQDSWGQTSQPPPPPQQQPSYNNFPPPGAQAPPPDPGMHGMPPPNVDPSLCISLQELQRQATAVVAFGNVYPVLPGSNLCRSITAGENAVKDVLRTEFMPPA